MMLEQFPNTLSFAADDAHLRNSNRGWNGGWITVNAKACERESITDAIRAGNFYSSCGPEIHTLEFDGTNVWIKTSPVQFIRLAGPGSYGIRIGSHGDEPIDQATIPIQQDLPYAYIEIEDMQGRRAWTNPLFVNGA